MDEKHFIEFFKDSVGVTEDVTMQVRPIEDLGLSSFEIMNLYSELQDEYDVQISNEEVVLIDTLEDLYDLIKSKLE